MGLSSSYLEAVPVQTRIWNRLTVWLVGCGGTGSWLAPHLARLAYELRERGKAVDLVFCDPDTVESPNVPRQNFCVADLGLPKALVLAGRYGMALGVPIGARVERFSPDMLERFDPTGESFSVLIGCVDNAAGRRSLHAALGLNLGYSSVAPSLWWLDCGNSEQAGQVLLGSAASRDEMRGAFQTRTMCRTLPSPGLQHPELLEPLPEEEADTTLSCAQLALLNAQSLTVNQQVAAIASDYLLRLLLTGGLRRYATYFHLPSGSSYSHYTSPAALQDYMPVSGKNMGLGVVGKRMEAVRQRVEAPI